MNLGDQSGLEDLRKPVTHDLMVLPHADDRARRFFERLTVEILPKAAPCGVIVITHLLPGRPVFLDALNKFAEIKAIIPKPKSVHAPTRAVIERSYRLIDASREELNDANRACEVFEQCSVTDRVAIMDIGGYFAVSAQAIQDRFPAGFLGVVEDTENGQQRYERLADRTFAMYSVARSPLKEPEDHLTGESVVFSMERILRLCGEVIYGRRAVVFGYGKVGRSAARTLASRGVRVSVVDTNPVRAIEASAHGFRVLEKRTGLATADLILGATGNFALRGDDFRYVRNGCFVASVTSSDDELDLADLTQRYTLESCSAFVTCYSRQGHYFYVMNNGNAVNFIDGGVLGPYVSLVQAEMMAALGCLLEDVGDRSADMSIKSVDSITRQRIAGLWIDVFNDNQIIIPGTL